MEYKLLGLFIIASILMALFIHGKILNKKQNYKNGFIIMAISFVAGIVMLISAITMI